MNTNTDLKKSGNAIICVVGARPNFMKMAPIMSAFATGPESITAVLVHTGQHYDEAMKDTFFKQLGIPEPDIDLEVGSGTHAVQTAEVMKRFEPVLDEYNPKAILVVGDVNSTIACALVAVKKGIPVIHVEAGLRSGDRAMPEEINRVLTDQISDFLFLTEASARDNLVGEGIDTDKIHFTGNVMIDTLIHQKKQAKPSGETIKERLGDIALDHCSKGYAVLTMHRPSNVDDESTLTGLLNTICEISNDLPVVFTVHPRTDAMMDKFGLKQKLELMDNIFMVPPLPYQELLGLMADATLVLTDSGGLQEETTALGVPCITLRENTERPITVDQGTNTIVGTDRDKILSTSKAVLAGEGKAGRVPELWDGKAAYRIKEVLLDWMNG